MIRSILCLFLALSVLACNQPVDKAHRREMFDAGGLQVITSFANIKQQTMSVLYGNAVAQRYAATGGATDFEGAILKLVVHRQADNKFWYGSHINGSLLSVETLSGKGDNWSYSREYGTMPANSGNRTAYILSHKPSVFP